MASITVGSSLPLTPTAFATASPRPPPNLRRCAIAPLIKSTKTAPSLGSSRFCNSRWLSVCTKANELCSSCTIPTEAQSAVKSANVFSVDIETSRMPICGSTIRRFPCVRYKETDQTVLLFQFGGFSTIPSNYRIKYKDYRKCTKFARNFVPT